MQRNASASASSSSLSLHYLRSQGSFAPQVTIPPTLHRTMTAPVLEKRERESSATTISNTSGAPTAAAGSIFNKPASVSLYQTCRIINDRLRKVRDFEDLYMKDVEDVGSPLSASATDPVSDLWRLFRLGASLCHIYNATLPEIELSVRPEPSTTNLNACKAEVYHFLLACKNHLHFADEDLFTISELYSENTNGFVKVTSFTNGVTIADLSVGYQDGL